MFLSTVVLTTAVSQFVVVIDIILQQEKSTVNQTHLIYWELFLLC